ncbi:MAG: MOSC domain-containing protein [Deltaproteobacteria bacterium]|nr:MOSC domain-containing protein [Deltaproteobacteria bacterium]
MHLSALYVYPIKSCGGVRLEQARLGPRGLEHDRRFMLVDEAGEFVTQRQVPRMALFRCALLPGGVRVSHAEAGEIGLPLEAQGERVNVRVWRDRLSAIHCREGSEYFSQALERPLRLVRLPKEATRVANPARAGEHHLVSFADGYPLLLTNASSLADLETRADREFSMLRFRPNLVIEGLEPWAEDELGGFELGGVPMRSVKPCERCSITCVDPETGEREVEPLRTLSRFRTIDGRVLFGVNVVHDAEGSLRVGDALSVT